MVNRVSRKAEWTLIVGVIAAVLNWLVGFQLDFLSAHQAAAWMVAINAVAAVVAAWKTRPIPPQIFTYLIASLAALGGAYQLHFDQAQVGAFTAVILSVLALLTRSQVSPANDVPAQVTELNRPVA
jgi:hypothetical protein